MRSVGSATTRCGWLTCKYRLLLDVTPHTGYVKVNRDGVELADIEAMNDDEVGELLDGTTLKEVG